MFGTSCGKGVAVWIVGRAGTVGERLWYWIRILVATPAERPLSVACVNII